MHEADGTRLQVPASLAQELSSPRPQLKRKRETVFIKYNNEAQAEAYAMKPGGLSTGSASHPNN